MTHFIAICSRPSSSRDRERASLQLIICPKPLHFHLKRPGLARPTREYPNPSFLLYACIMNEISELNTRICCLPYAHTRFTAKSLRGLYLASEPGTGVGEVLWSRVVAARRGSCVSSTSRSGCWKDGRGVSHSSLPAVREGLIEGGPRSRH